MRPLPEYAFTRRESRSALKPVPENQTAFSGMD